MMANSERDLVPLPLESGPGTEYHEDAFLYFLSVERSLANHANQALRLLLAAVEPVAGRPVPMGKALATRVFGGLRVSLRETDVVGWYRQDRVAGALLSAGAAADGADLSTVIERRVSEGLRQRLPPAVACDLRVRIIQLRRPLPNGQEA